MATTLGQLAGFLDEHDLRYRVDGEESVIMIAFACPPDEHEYKTPDGDAMVRLVIRLAENGELLSIFSPNAWNIDDCPDKGIILECIPAIQSQYKMLRFDFDPADGELRPHIDLLLEDSTLTSRQFHRLIQGLIESVRRFDRVIRPAMDTGEVWYALRDSPKPFGSPADELWRLNELTDRAGGFDESEKLIGGGDADADGTDTTPDSDGCDGNGNSG